MARNMLIDSEEECVICDELRGKQGLSSLVEFPPAREPHVMAETSGLVLLHDISPIVSGHCLIVTKAHVFSFAEADNCIWDEFNYIKQIAIESSMINEEGYFFFEHGVNSKSPKAGCVMHAHIHMIPRSLNVVHYLRLAASGPLHVGPINMRQVLPKDGSEYLYYEDMHGEGCMVVSPDNLQRQFIRFVVAQELDLFKWDWTEAVVNQRWVID